MGRSLRRFSACVLILILFSACVNWQQNANEATGYAHRAGVTIREIAGPIINEQCRQAAVECINSGINDPSGCPDFLKCNDRRMKLAAALVGLELAVADARVAIAAGSEKDALEAVAKLTDLAKQVRQQVTEMGLL